VPGGDRATLSAMELLKSPSLHMSAQGVVSHSGGLPQSPAPLHIPNSADKLAETGKVRVTGPCTACLSAEICSSGRDARACVSACFKGQKEDPNG
jgi:hypothetical protein